MHNARRRGKGQSRILYWFRTPPGVRVGRSAIDEDAIRLLEEHNPDVQFDWTHILKAALAPPPPTADTPREPPPRAVKRKDRRVPFGEERRAFPRADQRRPTAIDVIPAPVHEERAAIPDVIPVPDEAVDEPSVGAVDPSAYPPDRLFETRADEESGADEDTEEDEPLGIAAEDRTSAVFQRLGSEGLARLRARYAEVLARIAERSMDEQAREELKAQAERLNPDGWVTAEEVREALEQYEGIFEALRSQVGSSRRRRRRRSKNPGARA